MTKCLLFPMLLLLGSTASHAADDLQKYVDITKAISEKGDSAVFEVIPIPSDPDHPFDWCLYNRGGEGVAYHDGNGTAYDFSKNKTTGEWERVYGTRGEESDCNSEAEKLYGIGKNPYYNDTTYEKSWADSEDACWQLAEDGSCARLGHKTLNAGVFYTKDIEYFNHNGSYERAYEGVDYLGTPQILIDSEDLQVPIKENYYATLTSIEPNEWITYTVDVKYPGYYKVYALVSGQSVSWNSISFINADGNMVRKFGDEYDWYSYTELSFQNAGFHIQEEDYEHFMWKQLLGSERKGDNFGVYFHHAGIQPLTILFPEYNGNIGPLYFELYEASGAEETISNSPLTIFPNPTTNDFTISLGSNETCSISILNPLGQTVFQTETSEPNLTISPSLSAGIYTVSAKSESGTRCCRLIIK